MCDFAMIGLEIGLELIEPVKLQGYRFQSYRLEGGRLKVTHWISLNPSARRARKTRKIITRADIMVMVSPLVVLICSWWWISLAGAYPFGYAPLPRRSTCLRITTPQYERRGLEPLAG